MTGVKLLDIEYALYGKDGKVKIYDCFKQDETHIVNGKPDLKCLYDGEMAETPIPVEALEMEIVLMCIGDEGDFEIYVG